MVCLDHALRSIDRASDRLAARLSSRACAAIVAGRIPDTIDADLLNALEKVMLAAHIRASAADSMAYALSLDASEIPSSSRDAIRKFYSSIARSATKKTMSHVRDKLLSDVKSIALGVGRRKSIGTAMKAAGVSRDNPALFKTLLKTHSAMAFNTALWVTSSQDPRTWGYEYVTAGDDRVRAQHQELDGVRYPVGHKFWDTNAPPNGWNCRCTLRVIKRGERGSRSKAPKIEPKIDKEFAFNAGKLFSSG